MNVDIQELRYPFDDAYILKKRRSIRKKLLEGKNFLEKKIAILSGSTIGDIKNILEIFLLNHGIKPIFYEGLYGCFYEDAVYNNQKLIDFKPDIIYIHTTNKNINEFPKINSSKKDVEVLLEKEFSRYRTVWKVLEKQCACPIIQNNFEPLNYRLTGNSECYRESGSIRFINLLNEKFYEYARENNSFFINDIHYLSSSYGLERWCDNSVWYMYKYALRLEAIPTLCSSLSNIIKSIYGKNKKAIILDLDNTLWGGIIGDDGVDGIQIGNETAIAEAYLMFQKYIKQLKDIGVLMNICSKNNEQIAKQGFEHTSSVLKEEDFVCFKANWKPKYINIDEIIKEINLGAESIVFVDDNPLERDIVKKNILGVEVPELLKVEDYINVIDKNGYFEMTYLLEDDFKRNTYYKENKRRQDSKREFEDYNSYLKSLEMRCCIEPINNSNIKRVVQLINKTNQFNFTTYRLTESEVEKYVEDEQTIIFAGRLIDRFGDNGLVTVLIANIEEKIASIDLWVMSCRVFNRQLEYVIFEYLIEQCRVKGVTKLKGTYRQTVKNTILANFYKELGFDEVFKNETQQIYEMNLENRKEFKLEVMELITKE